MGEGVTDPAPTHPIQIHNFRAYWLARLTMTLAQYAMLLVIGWQAYNLARDSGMNIAEGSGTLAIIGLLQFLPLFLLTPFSGLAADRFDRRMLGLLTVILQLVCAATLAWFSWNDAISLQLLFVIAIALGIARGFAGPALSSLAPNLVPKALLPTAIALSSISWQVGALVGPAIGAIPYAFDPALPYALSAVLFAISAAALLTIGKVPQPAMRKDQRPIGAIVDGLRYVGQNRMVLSAITLDLFAVFLAGANALIPVFARDIIQTDENGLAMLASATPAGALVTAIVFSFRPLRTQVGPKMLGAVAVFGLATIVFGLSTSLPLSLAMLFIIGASDMFSVYVRQSLIQLHTPDDKRGRVSSVSMMTISASNEGGDAFSGSLAYLMGPVAAIVVGGAGALVTVAVWSRLFPVLRTTKTFDPPDNLLEDRKTGNSQHPQEA
ncbi:MFS transporter [Erythrobacter sp. JK5]|uniref:MFS transporter n=1 Tax=Erythrobacter sp. JK5 TaxID=2829500 RepID=UPI001BA4F9A9|nr:MFS transporter [Erythrobacter sp. JK5]QUL39354.1 MFS transporter [Erythrobacter sp. JK5]